MKVRWTRGGIRFRITPSELSALGQGQSVQETLELPGASWTAYLRLGSSTKIWGDGTAVSVELSQTDVARLEEPDREGLYFQADTPAPRFLIEKDFPCVHPRALHAAEPKTETFAAPSGFADRKGMD